MNKLIKIYLFLLPILALIGIILSVYRTAYQESYSEIFLLITAILDLIIILPSLKLLKNKNILFAIGFLLLSLLIGLINNELSRRIITDLTNPLFFFFKIYIFKNYWSKNIFLDYLKLYSNIALVGSLVLLPITYFLFNNAGATRLSIFPPMELPFSYFLQFNFPFLLLSLLIILLYGKRAQLVSAFIVLLINFTVIKKINLIKIFVIIFGIIFFGKILIDSFGENLAVRRITSTIENFNSTNDNVERLSTISAGRDEEIEAVLDDLNINTFFFGKGLGMQLELWKYDKNIGNIHFSPLSFIIKYGIFFTVFIYFFILFNLFKSIGLTKSNRIEFNAALAISLFVFFESFFAYSLFVTPIFNVAFGYLLFKNENKQS